MVFSYVLAIELSLGLTIDRQLAQSVMVLLTICLCWLITAFYSKMYTYEEQKMLRPEERERDLP